VDNFCKRYEKININFKSVVKVVLYSISDAQPEIQILNGLPGSKIVGKESGKHSLPKKSTKVECGKDKFFLLKK
jgi:hypothetical protein